MGLKTLGKYTRNLVLTSTGYGHSTRGGGPFQENTLGYVTPFNNHKNENVVNVIN